MALETTGAGVLDGVIVDWHDRFGFGNANRDRFPEGGYQQRLTDARGTTYLDVGRKGLALDDIRAFAKWRAFRSSDAPSLLSVRTEVRVRGPLWGRANRRRSGAPGAGRRRCLVHSSNAGEGHRPRLTGLSVRTKLPQSFYDVRARTISG